MCYKIIWLNQAIEELKEIRHYIEVIEEAPESAATLTTKIYEAASSLSFMPERFQKDSQRPKYRRMMVLSTYSIFYQIKGTVVYIAHIWNSARDKSNLR